MGYVISILATIVFPLHLCFGIYRLFQNIVYYRYLKPGIIWTVFLMAFTGSSLMITKSMMSDKILLNSGIYNSIFTLGFMIGLLVMVFTSRKYDNLVMDYQDGRLKLEQ